MGIVNLDPERFYRTDDMAMATYLKMEGFTPQQVGWISDTCYWWFTNSDALVDAVECFHAGEATGHDLREYSRQFALSKREFYDTKNIRTASAS